MLNDEVHGHVRELNDLLGSVLLARPITTTSTKDSDDEEFHTPPDTPRSVTPVPNDDADDFVLMQNYATADDDLDGFEEIPSDTPTSGAGSAAGGVTSGWVDGRPPVVLNNYKKPTGIDWNAFFRNTKFNIHLFLYNLSIKSVVNTIYHRTPGKIINTIMSIGIVQMTLTSVLYYPYISTAYAALLAYTYIQDRAKPETNFQNTKIAIGAGALLLNYISPFVFSPAQNMFLFMSYLYFSLGAYGMLTSSDEKTLLLSRISALTGANAFVIESPFIYLTVLTLFHRGDFDDIITEKAPTLAWTIIPSIKESARNARNAYLISIGEIAKDSFKTSIDIPIKLLERVYHKYIEPKLIERDFVTIS
jgi:hypothetical protein